METDLKTVDVWLEVGREGRCFTYLDGNHLGIEVGDLVLVRLRGRKMQGIVVKTGSFLKGAKNLDENYENFRKYEYIDSLVESSVIDSRWRDWIEVSANSCYTTNFRMLKAAMPPGWLGHRKKYLSTVKSLWWVSIKDDCTNQKKLSARQIELKDYLRLCGGALWQKDLLANGFSLKIIQGLIDNGFAEKEKRPYKKKYRKQTKKDNLNDKYSGSNVLTDEQNNSIKVFSALPKGAAMLLWGVTGSGKTEVYLQLASMTIANGQSCLILAPEIGLIPQLIDRFRSRFGEIVFEYHSGCPENERIKTWVSSRNTLNPLIVIGTRSAIFLPLTSLGLIVMDEEHDNSYKQESPMPCYDARSLALNRVKNIGAKLVLGSATPSLKTWKEVEPRGEIELARLTRRISNRPLPKVSVVDMRKEFADGHRRLFSRYLMKRISTLKERNEQAVVLVPRRGYSSFLSCRSCGEVVQCPNCDVALTVHKSKQGNQFLRCHWCDYCSDFGSNCHECGSKAFKPFGAGTQRVLEQLLKELEGLRVLRFDRDTTFGRDGHRKVLERFADGQADVLIGTQMLAKGMDLPNVTISAVVAADGLLYRPDIQAEEESLQLFLQLAGRAGRGEIPGEVIIQTYCPDHPVICHLEDGRYEEFLEKEAKLRQEGNLVPYGRACLLRLSGESSSLTASSAAALANRLKPKCISHGWILVGPAPSMVAKIAGKTRWQLLLHGPQDSELPLPKDSVSLWKDLPKGVSLSIDPDPIHL